MIIDIHAHTSNNPLRNLHVDSASIEMLENQAKTYGVTKIVLLATYFSHKGTGVHNLDLWERIGGRELFLMFGSLDVENALDSGLAELELLAKEGKIAGIKLYPGYQGFEPSEPQLNDVYLLAERFNLPIMLHGGGLHYSDTTNQELARPAYVEKPARDHPKVKFVVSHMANPYFSELREVMELCPNVHTDISGQMNSGSYEDNENYRRAITSEIKKFLACPRGSERVLFGTDFPIQSYASSLDLVNRLELSIEDRENILVKNALRVLKESI